jgi:hypothetical protein
MGGEVKSCLANFAKRAAPYAQQGRSREDRGALTRSRLVCQAFGNGL